MNKIVCKAIKFYTLTFSQILRNLFGTGCRFSPSCSQYALECFEALGFLRATKLSVLRVLKCHPFASGGYDPVKTS